MRGRSWADFFVARFARIWPAHIASLILLFLAFWPWSEVYFTTTLYVQSLVLNIGLLQDWFPVLDFYGGYNSVSWSLSAEMFFYALFPFLVASAIRRPVLLFIGTTAIISGSLVAIPMIFPWADVGWLKSMNLVAGLFSFLVGVFAGLQQKRYKHLTPRLGYFTWSVVEVAGVVFALSANAYMSEHSRTPYIGLSGLLHGNAAAPAYALMIVILSVSRGCLSRFLSSNVMVYLGEVSFAFYLVHQIVIRCYVERVDVLKHWPQSVQFLVVAAVSLLLSMAMMHLVERPARAGIVRAWKSRHSFQMTASGDNRSQS